MAQPDVSAAKSNPRRFLNFLKEQRLPVYHKSNIFFRDFQFGLWRYLQQNQTKISYADLEHATREVIEHYKRRGIFKEIDRQTFELQMPGNSTASTTFRDGKTATEPPKGKPAPASGPAATQAPAAAPLPPTVAGDPEKAAKLAELQAKMAAAKAKREAEAPAPVAQAAPAAAAAPAEAAPAPAAKAAPSAGAAPTGPVKLYVPPGNPELAAKLADLQARMEEARARRLAGE